MFTNEPDYIKELRGADLNDPVAQSIRNEWIISCLDDRNSYDAYIIPETKVNKFIIWIFNYKKLWK